MLPGGVVVLGGVVDSSGVVVRTVVDTSVKVKFHEETKSSITM